MKFTYAPVLGAYAARGKDRLADSVERLEIARRYELAANGLNFQFLLSWWIALGLCAGRGAHGGATECRSRRPSFKRSSTSVAL